MIKIPASPLDLSPVHPRQMPARVRPRAGSQPDAQPERAREDGHGTAEARRFREALEDVVALAGASADPSARVIQMRRRALAALSGLDPRP